MTQRMYVKPATEKTVVRMPEKQYKRMPSAGAWVRRNAYYARRLREGSIVNATPPTSTRSTAQKAKAAAPAASGSAPSGKPGNESKES